MVDLVIRRFRVVALVGAACVLQATHSTPQAWAFEPMAAQLPCSATEVNSVGATRPCITCHSDPNGGTGCPNPAINSCLNQFGEDFQLIGGNSWSQTLALMDSDGDGYTNGEELGDPLGLWVSGMMTPSTCDCATNPGSPQDTPGDADGDSYCCRGLDMNADGDCRDPGEDDGVSFDCDDDDPTVNSSATEMCVDSIDSDCDGLTDFEDDDCASFVDTDMDGYCLAGRDLDGNGECTGTGENVLPGDCDETNALVNPVATEVCTDQIDNDCDGDVDQDDNQCGANDAGTGDASGINDAGMGDAGTGDASGISDAGTGDASGISDAGTGDASGFSDAGTGDASGTSDASGSGDASRDASENSDAAETGGPDAGSGTDSGCGCPYQCSSTRHQLAVGRARARLACATTATPIRLVDDHSQAHPRNGTTTPRSTPA